MVIEPRKISVGNNSENPDIEVRVEDCTSSMILDICWQVTLMWEPETERPSLTVPNMLLRYLRHRSTED